MFFFFYRIQKPETKENIEMDSHVHPIKSAEKELQASLNSVSNTGSRSTLDPSKSNKNFKSSESSAFYRNKSNRIQYWKQK